MKRIGGGWKILLTGVFIIVFACSDDELSENEYVNRWVQSGMKRYYLWNEGMPSPRKSQSPYTYFDQLLSEDDRFSWIEDDYEELLNSLKGINKESGYKYVFYNPAGTTEVYGHVKYIKPNSPAASADLLRGDVITHINGQLLTTANAEDLIGLLQADHSIQYERYNVETSSWENKGTLSLSTVEYAENPNYLHTIIETGGHKIGYYVYNFFAPGPNSSNPEQYNNEMNSVFAEFKNEGVTDLIVDLRYNSGGSETATIKLASLIGSNISAMDVFVYREYNARLTKAFAGDAEAFKTNFTIENNNIGSQISSKLYVITSRERTASASELLINGLRPYMDVILVGGVTIGKNVGSFSLYAKDDPKNTWGMQPIVVKSYNSEMESDYSTGFVPDVLISELENGRRLYPLGDPEEPLLAKTIEQITGIAARIPKGAKVEVSEITSSVLKGKNFNLLIDDPHVVERLKEEFKHGDIEVQ